MDERIHEEVSKPWNDIANREHLILEGVQKSLGSKRYRLVDVGCGSSSPLARVDRAAAYQADSLGIDINREALASNPDVKYRVCASCYSLPLKSNSVDIIVCRWVLEHLEFPAQVMAEFSRILKKGGFVYVKTPNLWNYTMLLSWITPMAFHNLSRSARGMGDNTPTFYRANTKRRLRALATSAGFAVRSLDSYSYSYMYYAFNRHLFVVMKGISKLASLITDSMQQTLLCVLEKVGDDQKSFPNPVQAI